MKMYWYRLKFTFILNGPINNIPALVQIIAWRRPGDKPLWTNADLIHWRIYAALGEDELIPAQVQVRIGLSHN